jgi:hypothetical protein
MIFPLLVPQPVQWLRHFFAVNISQTLGHGQKGQGRRVESGGTQIVIFESYPQVPSKHILQERD